MVYYIILILDLLWPRLSRSFELPWGWTSTGFQVISSQDPWISFFPILTHGTAPWHCRCRMWTELCSTPCGCDLNWDCLIPRLTNPTGNWAQVQGWFRERCLSRHLRLFVPTTIAPRCVLIASFLQGPRHGQKRADENGAELQENMVCRIILFDVPSGKLT